MKERCIAVASIVIALALVTLACTTPGITMPVPAPTVVTAPSIRPTSVSLPFRIQVVGVTAEQTVLVTLTIWSTGGPQTLLFDTPLLSGEPPTPGSLEQARFGLLDLSTGGHAQIALEFPRPACDPPWVLVFNPRHTGENYVAPRVEITVEITVEP